MGCATRARRIGWKRASISRPFSGCWGIARDYADRGQPKIMALEVGEFLRRFLLHVLPRRFVRIRHFGLLANRQRRTTLTRARQLLGAATPPTSSDASPAADLDPTRCPICHQGHWHVVEILRPLAPAPVPVALNTS